MRDLDISFIPAKFVFFWWLSRVMNYEKIIISPEQVFIFGSCGAYWDMYRDHLILVKESEDGFTSTSYINEYLRNKQIKPYFCKGKRGSKTLKGLTTSSEKKAEGK
jgi:hypothetical protein